MSEWKGVSPRLRKYDGAEKWGNEGVVTGVNVLNGTGAVGESAELIGLGGGERIGVEGLPDGDESVDVPVVEFSILVSGTSGKGRLTNGAARIWDRRRRRGHRTCDRHFQPRSGRCCACSLCC